MEYQVKFKNSRILMYIIGTLIFWIVAIIIICIIAKNQGGLSTSVVLLGMLAALTIYTIIELRKEIKYRKLSYLKYDESKIVGYSYLSNTTIDCDIADADIAVVGNTIMIEIKNDVSFVIMQVKDAKEHCARIKEMQNRTPSKD